MIIRNKHKQRFVTIPNAIFRDRRLSVGAKGLLGHLLSLPRDWQVRHDQVQRELGIGRKLLEKLFRELIAAGYAARDEIQGRDERNRFMTLNYIVSDVPNSVVSDAPSAVRREPKRRKSNGNNKEEIKTDFTNPFSKSLPAARTEAERTGEDQYATMGMHALASGQCAVFVGSKPYEAWVRFRGEDGMPKFVDRATIKGQVRELVWMPSLYPPGHSSDNA